MNLWTKKSLEDLNQELVSKDQPEFKRTLGPLSLIMFGIGAVIGAGLFSITGIVAAEHAGPAILISFLVAAIGCAFAGLCYCELASLIPMSGSAYTYAFVTMGEFIAWIIGWSLILEYAIGASTVAISWSGYVVSLLQNLNIHLPPELSASPWQPVLLHDGTHAYGWINLPALLITIALSMLLISGIKHSSSANTIIVSLKIMVIIVFILVGFSYINPENFTPFIPPNTGEFGAFGWSGIMRGAGVLFFAYIGFDAVSTVAQETKKPQRDLPIGMIGSLIICTFLYIAFTFVLVGIVNYKELGVTAPVALAINKIPYRWLDTLIKLAILAGFTSVILVLLLGQSRIFYAMARDNLLPSIFSHVHPKYRTPVYSNLILMVFVGVIAAFAPLNIVGDMSSIGTLLAFIIVCVSVLILRRTHAGLTRPFRTPFSPLVPILGILFCAAMMLSLGMASWLRLILWLALGIVFYFWRKRSSALEIINNKTPDQ